MNIMNNWLKHAIASSHEDEDLFNKRIGIIDKQIKQLNIEKSKIAKKISKNMKRRNKLIEQLRYNNLND